jgi:hypothetical protein
MDSVWDEERRRYRRTDRGCDRRSLREPDRPDYARTTYGRTAAVPSAAYERHGDYASCRSTWHACGRHFRLNRTAPDWATRQRAHYFAAPRGMQPLFSSGMSDRFSLHESGQRRRSRACCAVDAGQVNFTFEIDRRDHWQFAASLPPDMRRRFQIREIFPRHSAALRPRNYRCRERDPAWCRRATLRAI